MGKIKNLLKSILFYLVFLFLALRLLNLTLLPIFNDEAIYLDWGWRELHSPGLLFYSLYDAKQPLLMWIFGVSETLVKDPLFAGRIVSVFFGLIAASGLYKLGVLIFSKKVGYIAFFLYTIIPIFSFYDRQALMEASIGAVGVWSFYFLYKSIELKKTKYFVFLGIVLGTGFLIKSSALVFLLSSFITVIVCSFGKRKSKYLKSLCWLLLAFIITDLLLLIQPEFWKTLSTNSRFSLAPLELIKFPIFIWISNLSRNFKIMFMFFTPIIFLGVILGLYQMLKNKKKYEFLLLFVLASFILETLLIRETTPRYLVPFLSLFILPCAFAIETLSRKFSQAFTFSVFFSIPIFFVVVQVFNPVGYFDTLSYFTSLSEKTSYISSHVSGYATLDVVKYLEVRSKKQKIGVGTALNTGNPESAITVYFNKNKDIKVFYFDSQIAGDLSKVDCFYSNSPIYFVSREDQLVGLDKFLIKEKKFLNIHGGDSVGIYRLRECNGIKYKIEI